MSDTSQASSVASDVGGEDSLKLVIVCVGLPARGKSYITKKLARYMNWMQFNTKIFNVGNTRRQQHGTPSEVPIQGPTVQQDKVQSISMNHGLKQHATGVHDMTATSTTHDSSFFDNDNEENLRIRESWARETLDRLLNYLFYEDGNVGIFDATNTTKQRRKWIVETINQKAKGRTKVLFLESICTDRDLIEKNIRLKLRGPDYRKMDDKLALSDFRRRLENYEKVYESIDETEEMENEKYGVQYVKIINAGKKLISYNISGYLSSQAVVFLMNFNLSDRQIWLTTNGESEYNLEHRKGGDSDLTPTGWKFAHALPRFIGRKRKEFKLRQMNRAYLQEDSFHSKPQLEKKFNVWTSTVKRTNQTTHFFPKNEYHFKSFKLLNDIGCGSFDSITESEFRSENDYGEYLSNKLSYRYPGLGGESYLDLIARLRPIIVELERLKDHVCIVTHTVIVRVLLCYFMNLDREMLTELDVQHGYVYCVEPKPYGLDLKIWQYNEVTDDFYEMDEIELMKRKRTRLPTRVISDEEEDEGEEEDSESSSEDGEHRTRLNMSQSQYEKLFCGRSNSQSYEFASSRQGSIDGSIPNSRSGSKAGSVPATPERKVNSGADLEMELARILCNDELVNRLKSLLLN